MEDARSPAAEAPRSAARLDRRPFRFVQRRPNPVFSPEYRGLIGVLIEVRREAGLSQSALAGRIEKSPSHIARIERGQRRVDALEVYRLAQALELDPVDLFRRLVDGVATAAASADSSKSIKTTVSKQRD